MDTNIDKSEIKGTNREEDEIIIMIRSDTVIKKINNFVTKYNLDKSCAQTLFNGIYAAACPLIPPIPPEYTLFCEKSVDAYLNNNIK